MNIKIDKREFLNALKTVSKNINKQNTIAILDCVLLSVYEHNVNILSSNGDTQIDIDVPVIESEGEGNISFKPAEVLKVLGSVDDEQISLVIENNALTIEYDGGKYTCQCLSADDYPKPDFVSDDVENFSVPFTDIINMLKYASIFCSTDDIRPVTKCVYATVENGEMTVASTDLHVCFYTSAKINYGGSADFLISPSVMSVLSDIKYGSVVEIGVGERHLFFGIGNVRILSRKVLGKFPNFKAVFPKNHTTEVIMDVRKFGGAIKRAMTAASTTSLCVLNVQNLSSEAVITAEDFDRMSKGEEKVENQANGADLTIGFSGATMLKCLSVITAPSVLLNMTECNNPIEIVDATDTSKHMVMMPMIVQNS